MNNLKSIIKYIILTMSILSPIFILSLFFMVSYFIYFNINLFYDIYMKYYPFYIIIFLVSMIFGKINVMIEQSDKDTYLGQLRNIKLWNVSKIINKLFFVMFVINLVGLIFIWLKVF